MGCVQAKTVLNSPARGGLEKLKIDSGYAGGRGRPHAMPKKPAKVSDRLSHHKQRDNAAGAPAAVGLSVRNGKVVTKDGEGGGSGSSRRSSRQNSGEDLVDGWPRWLTDNIPREALAGLVPKSAESYDKLDKIGQGTYSNVYKARDRDTRKIVALKKVRFDTSEPESVRFMAREITILRRLDHPNVIKLEGLATSRMQYSLYLVFDFMQSDLARIVSRPDGKLTEPQIKCYMQQLLAGLQHCHERGILHRDIKGSNLLIDRSGMLKIADFGLANYFNPNQKRPLTSRVVTLWYRAPELLLGSTDYGVGIDLWSAGCLLAEMFAGRAIMPGRTEVEQIHRIFKLCGSPSEDYWRKLKLTTSFRPPQEYKPSILETFRDLPASSLSLLTVLLALDPSNRGSSSSALQSEFFSTRPLACDLSGLPVIYKEEENESTQSLERRKRRSNIRRSRKNRDHGKKEPDAEKPRGDSGSSKEEREKSPAANSHSQDMGSGTGSTSSSVPRRHEISPKAMLSPIAAPSLLKTSSARTECHPWASRNIKNLPPLLAPSKTNIHNDKEGNDEIFQFSLVGRSASTSDFRRMDVERMLKHYAFDG